MAIGGGVTGECSAEMAYKLEALRKRTGYPVENPTPPAANPATPKEEAPKQEKKGQKRDETSAATEEARRSYEELQKLCPKYVPCCAAQWFKQKTETPK